MNKALLFKMLQRRNKYRNPSGLLEISDHFVYSEKELKSAQDYIDHIKQQGIRYTYPGCPDYPKAFYEMLEPPLFIEYMGNPCWKSWDFLSVVGSRDCHDLTTAWISTQLVHFLKLKQAAVVSGGALGVDMNAHIAALRAGCPTVVVLPCGLNQIYPKELKHWVTEILNHGGCLISEFEWNQTVHKSYFYFRNRLISSLGRICLVAQAGVKSGTMLTVHHALQNGRPVAVVPSHPSLNSFAGNIKLINEGALLITDSLSLNDLWQAEGWSRSIKD